MNATHLPKGILLEIVDTYHNAIVVLISAMALFVSFSLLLTNAYFSRRSARAAEFDSVQKLWKQHQEVVDELFKALEGKNQTEIKIKVLNYATHVENVCLLYNRKYCNGLLRETAFSMATDAIASNDSALAASNITYKELIVQFNISDEGFAETIKFMEEHKAKINYKKLRARGSMYDGSDQPD